LVVGGVWVSCFCSEWFLVFVPLPPDSCRPHKNYNIPPPPSVWFRFSPPRPPLCSFSGHIVPNRPCSGIPCLNQQRLDLSRNPRVLKPAPSLCSFLLSCRPSFLIQVPSPPFASSSCAFIFTNLSVRRLVCLQY